MFQSFVSIDDSGFAVNSYVWVLSNTTKQFSIISWESYSSTSFCTSLVVVQLLSHVRLFVTPWTAAGQDSLSFTISRSLLRLMSMDSEMPSNHLILCHPLLLLPEIFPSTRVFSNEWALCIRQSKYWSFIQLQHQSFQ